MIWQNTILNHINIRSILLSHGVLAWYINLNDIGNQQYCQTSISCMFFKKEVKSSLQTLEWYEKDDIGPALVGTFLLELVL